MGDKTAPVSSQYTPACFVIVKLMRNCYEFRLNQISHYLAYLQRNWIFTKEKLSFTAWMGNFLRVLILIITGDKIFIFVQVRNDLASQPRNARN